MIYVDYFERRSDNPFKGLDSVDRKNEDIDNIQLSVLKDLSVEDFTVVQILPYGTKEVKVFVIKHNIQKTHTNEITNFLILNSDFYTNKCNDEYSNILHYKSNNICDTLGSDKT